MRVKEGEAIFTMNCMNERKKGRLINGREEGRTKGMKEGKGECRMRGWKRLWDMLIPQYYTPKWTKCMLFSLVPASWILACTIHGAILTRFIKPYPGPILLLNKNLVDSHIQACDLRSFGSPPSSSVPPIILSEWQRATLFSVFWHGATRVL